MASPKHFSIVLLISLLATSLANARESQFFSKATKETTSTVHVPDAEQQQQQQQQQQVVETSTKQQVVDDPNFIPQTTPTGYGLYGQESNQPQKTPTTTTPTTFPDDDVSLYGKFDDPTTENLYEQIRRHTEKNNNYYNNKDTYVTDEAMTTDFGNRYSSAKTSLADRNNYYAGDNKEANYVTDQESEAELGNSYTSTSNSVSLADRNNYYTGGNTYGNVQRQGMSDTRFLENGKYYYNVDNEEKYYPNYRAGNSMVSSRSGEYNPNMMTGRYEGNTDKNPRYENNGNAMEGYEQKDEEFQDVQDSLEP